MNSKGSVDLRHLAEINVKQLRHLIHAGLLMIFLAPISEAAAAEPTSVRTIIPTGQERAIVKSTPIEMRPYRPLHVYGNTVRRRHYHGTAIPMPRSNQPSYCPVTALGHLARFGLRSRTNGCSH